LNDEKQRPVGENGLIKDEFAAAKACKDIRGGFWRIFQKHRYSKKGLAKYCFQDACF